ncbi:MAG: hypothetical protein K8953_09300, partial [Proteobacteria bacterium]|nr:hypothetical protein [Pseudomonadota bacterium]
AFNDWLRDFGGFPPFDRLTATEPKADRKREFLTGGTAGLATTGAVDIVTNVTANLGTGNESDGYHYFVDRVATGPFLHVPYAGLLSGTDLGAPITDETSGTTTVWNGRLKAARSGTVATDAALELTITFGGLRGEMGSIEGAVKEFNTTGYELKGTYDASGVINGTVYYGPFNPGTPAVRTSGTNTNGILTGLIGEQGAVGVFIAGNQGSTKGNLIGTATTGINNYVGGFVAAYTPPPPPLPSVATHANFKTYYAHADRVHGKTLHPTPTTTADSQAFVEGTATGLPTDGLDFTASGRFEPIPIRLKEEATGDNGFAVMFGTAGNSARFRAGLLSGTDLGPAVPTTSTAIWAGSFHFWSVASSTPNRIALPTVSVDFANGTITAPAITVATDNTVTINGKFGAGLPSGTPAGILGGTVTYSTSTNYELPLIGLIGTKGAIGVFHGNNLVFVGGGFQASPN